MNSVLSLGLLTLRSPAQAAHLLLSRAWPREAIWTGLFLAAVLNALAYGLMTVLFPLPPEFAMMRLSSVTYVALSAGLILGVSVAVTVCGRFIGGKGAFADVLAVMIWLQIVRVGIQAGLILVTILSPGLGGLFSLVVNLYLFFVLLHFVNAAHRFNSLWRAFGVLLMASLLALFTLTFVLGLFGPENLGLPAYV
ncbi:YIP1 family protein [Phaeobacter sp. PT47_59]|uniref:YIP1 family protein n=1 Tax=Phaeobacter sp. PT47_59 TaxID=3029979 RepID=UPI00238012F9|nr:YIP1 family protein [Phaeobacter sp. PT47_59]MDE4172543.1 YIP1 family protein [Phaeobacter sp. PT47_59]